MIDSVNPLTRSLAMLRIALARSGGHASRGQSLRSAPPGQSTESSRSELALLPGRLDALSADAPDREAQALKLFIRAVLIDEFPAELHADPELDQLTDRVIRQLELDEALTVITQRALDELLGGRKG